MAQAVSSTIGVDLDNTSTTQLFALGTHVLGSSNSEWVYVIAGGTVTAFKVVAFTPSGTCGMASGNDMLNGLQLAVAQTSFTTGVYGWVAIRGQNLGVMTTGSATAVPQGIFLAASGTPTGMLSNVASASGTVAGIQFNSVAQTATQTVTGALISWPRGFGVGM